MFKLKNSLANKKAGILDELTSKLNELPAKINVIKEFEVGVNYTDSERAFDLALLSSFNSEEDIQKYRVHPDHQKVVEYIKETCEKTHVVDYEV